MQKTKLALDASGNPIPGGTRLKVVTVAINGDTFTAVPIPASEECKYLLAKTRSAGDWKLSDTEDGAAFFTVPGTLSLELAASAESTMFYAKGAGADVLELILVK